MRFFELKNKLKIKIKIHTYNFADDPVLEVLGSDESKEKKHYFF